MKTIINIARTELKTLFYSPIAWLILAIFTIQSNMMFIELLERCLRLQLMNYPINSFTSFLYTDPSRRALFPEVQEYLYLYIPLLTMGLLSREISSGSIKLLFSSPVSSRQIVFGKYLSMMLYGLFLIGILILTIVFSRFGVKDLDVPYLLSGLLGMYLLLCAYSAIGLFMSSLTSYQVVAALGTLASLAVLNYVGDVGQGINFVREITYWLSISGRADEMVGGLISTEDVLYFLIVIAMFLGFTIVKLQSGKIKNKGVIAGRYALVVLIGLIVGYLSSRPVLKMYADATATKHRTLTLNSQKIIKQLEGGLTITTYVNLLDHSFYMGMPTRISYDMSRYEQYTRFKPEIKLNYVYYWDKSNNEHLYRKNPNLNDEELAKKQADAYNVNFDKFLRPEQIRKIIDLSGEDNRFVSLIERESGEKTFLRIFNDLMRYPSETEISAALKRLIVKCPKVGFLTGHGERSILKAGDRDYSSSAYLKTFRNALINQGFDLEVVDLSKGEIAKDINILVISDIKVSLSEIEEKSLKNYINNGGNLLIAAEPKRREIMSSLVERFGVRFVDGIMVEQSENFIPTLILNDLAPEVPEKTSYVFGEIRRRGHKVTMPEGLALDYSGANSKGFKAVPLLQTKWKGCWNEMETTDFVDEKVELNTRIGEIEKSYEMAVALSRKMSGKEQRIVILGDADCFSNGEISKRRVGFRAANFTFFTGVFEWLSHGQSPVDTRRPDSTDTQLYITKASLKFWNVVFVWLIPLGIVVTYLMIWLKRRKK